MSGFMIGAAALAAVPALVVGGGAGGSPEVGERLAGACERVPIRIEQVGRAQERLAAGDATPGSIAFLQRRIDRAEAAGDQDWVRLLTDRMAVRRDVQDLLPKVLTSLRDAEAICREHDGSVSTEPSA